MSVAEDFRSFLANISIQNSETISLRYGEVTAALNKTFRDSDSKTANSLQVGSYGRWTAIQGISDLDMIYIMPAGLSDHYMSRQPYSLLKDTRDAISARYPSTTVRVDRLVVRALYKDFQIEVMPAFLNTDGNFIYPDTAGNGSWKVTKPRPELAEMSAADQRKNRNLRRLCKMIRAWKNRHGGKMGGLLIDTLAYRFLNSTHVYDSASYRDYDRMMLDFFTYLSELPKQSEYSAVGSNQRVRVRKPFQHRAKKAARLCQEAINASGQANERQKWRDVFGNAYPSPRPLIEASFAAAATPPFRQTEEFIEDSYPVDVRYSMSIDCEVSQKGFRPTRLGDLLTRAGFLYKKKSLKFFVSDRSDLPAETHIFWKVLNCGPEAERRDCIRGQIERDQGSYTKTEHSIFNGAHIVEAYGIFKGVVIARDQVYVPIFGPDNGEVT